jgi:hypothetical protein
VPRTPTTRIRFVPADIAVVHQPLTSGDPHLRQLEVEFKTLAFQNDARLSAASYEIKRLRAFFDSNLGPSGGWRCPLGSANGGEITDRFGRNCGGASSRRLLNTVRNVAGSTGTPGKRRRERPVVNNNVGGRVRSDVAEEGEGVAPPKRRKLRERILQRVEDIADRWDDGDGSTPGRRRRGAVVEDAGNRPRPGRTRTADGLPPLPTKRSGPDVDVDKLSDKQRAAVEKALDESRLAIRIKWQQRIASQITEDSINEFIADLETTGAAKSVITKLKNERDSYLSLHDDSVSLKDKLGQMTANKRRTVLNRAKVMNWGPETKPGEDEKPRPAGAGMWQAIATAAKARLGARHEHGYGIPVNVPVGHRGIGDQKQANGAVDAGADLIDIPDEFLAEAIAKNTGDGKRFKSIADTSNSKNGMAMYEDRKTGKAIGIKFRGGTSAASQEDLSELAGAHIAERFGFAGGSIRVGGIANSSPQGNDSTAVPLVFELVGNYVGKYDKPDRNSNRSMAQIDRLRATLLDFTILNMDRHPGNYFTVTDKDGKLRFVPIDHGYGFNSAHEMFSVDGDEKSFKGWLFNKWGGRRNGIMKNLRDEAGTAEGRAELVELMRDTQRQLREAEEQYGLDNALTDIFASLPDRTPRTSSGRDHRKAVERIQWLINTDPEKIVDLLLGQP